MYFSINIFSIVIFVLSFHTCLGQSEEDPVVAIESGLIRGRMDYTVEENNTYYTFQGIPYAKPPIGKLRFSAPVKVSNWTGILNTTEDGESCVQDSDPVLGQEDCLFINVYTPSLSGANRTVMVWIYGGTFISGYSTYPENGPDYLLDQDVVFVSFNYRVGIFGFLSTEDLAIPGNWGLKDQLLALEWVRDNIENFGGNASDVTVFGQSAGAASLAYLLQSNRTTGLLNKAILQSGTSLNLWALNRRAKKTALLVGFNLGFVTANSSVLLEYLRGIDYETLQSTAMTVSTLITLENALQGILFSPVIEPQHEGAVIVNLSDRAILQGDFHRVPVLIGATSNEAATFGGISALFRLYLLNYDVSVENLAPYNLSTNFNSRLFAGFCVKLRYFGVSLVASGADRIIEFISDDQFNRPIRRMVQNLAQYVPVYFYRFSYEGNLFGVTNRTLTGVGHSEDLGYIFRRTVSELPNITESDELMRARMVKLWTNFAKFGNPTPTSDSLLENIVWESVGTDPSNLTYMELDATLSIQQNPFNDSMEFYDDIYVKYGDPPYGTY